MKILDQTACKPRFFCTHIKKKNGSKENSKIVMVQLLLPYRWKKFCGDTSIEKAGLYFEGWERGSSDSIDGFASSNPEIESLDGWSLVDSLSELKVSQPGKRKQIGDLW